MQIAKGMDKFTGFETADLGHHHRQHRIRGNVERDAQKQVCAALIELATQLAFVDEKLEEGMAWRQRHFIQLSRIPRADYQTPAVRINFDLFDDAVDLINVLAIGTCPISPLRTVNAP